MDWTRKDFSAAGVTQFPVGPHLPALQARFTGTVMLMIDVSGSMGGAPLAAAVGGARQFVAEAVAAHYRVGLMLWNTGVVAVSEPSLDGAGALEVLNRARSSGGTRVLGPLEECHRILGDLRGDRVVALFGDGDLNPLEQVHARVATMKAERIRFVTRGLGAAAEAFGAISDEDLGTARVESVDRLAAGIATMATALKSTRQ